MAISLEDLLAQIAKDGVRAKSAVKLENVSFFHALFDKDENGKHIPSDFAIKLLEAEVLLPLINTMDQDQFSLKELDLEFETEASLTTTKENKILVDCTMKKGLLRRNTMLKIKMKLVSEEPTEGIEQIRESFANRLSDQITNAKREGE